MKRTEEKTHTGECQERLAFGENCQSPLPQMLSLFKAKKLFITHPPNFFCFTLLQPRLASADTTLLSTSRSHHHLHQCNTTPHATKCGFYMLWSLSPTPAPKKHPGWAAAPVFLIGSLPFNQKLPPTPSTCFLFHKNTNNVER